MNPLYKEPTNRPTLKEFMASMTPEGAKNRVNQLLNSGQMSQQQFDSLKEQASQIAKIFGIK